jgi:cytosolic carboxypeptidase protein 2/3
MKIIVYSIKKNQETGISWHRSCSNIHYFKSKFYRDEKEKDNPFYSLSFSHVFEYDDDEVFFSYNYPYTYTDL